MSDQPSAQYTKYETWEDLHHGPLQDAMRAVVEVKRRKAGGAEEQESIGTTSSGMKEAW